jgi:dephospho-CoA kinase
VSLAKHNSLRIGVTGGIGSGKSAVTQMLEQRGIEVVDADVIARLVVERGSQALSSIAEHFGSTILRPDGTLDRAALRAIIFKDEAERQWLENLLHPLIRAETIGQLEASTSPYSVLSSPLLLETSQDMLVDKVLLVDTSEALQIERTQQRDSIDADAVGAIIASQWSRAKRQAKADYIINNDGSFSELEEAVEKMHQQFLALAGLSKAKKATKNHE